MAIKYTWNCNTVETYPTSSGFNDVVFEVHWRLKASDVINEVSQSYDVVGTQAIDVSSLDSGSFIEWDNLKEKDVIGWVTASMGSEVVTAHKTAASSSLLEIANPVVVTKTLS